MSRYYGDAVWLTGRGARGWSWGRVARALLLIGFDLLLVLLLGHLSPSLMEGRDARGAAFLFAVLLLVSSLWLAWNRNYRFWELVAAVLPFFALLYLTVGWGAGSLRPDDALLGWFFGLAVLFGAPWLAGAAGGRIGAGLSRR